MPDYVQRLLNLIEKEGFTAWCVGGCVRDALLGRAVNDYDIATDARWEQTEKIVTESGYAAHRTGTKHGTITVVVDGHAMEVTTYRADGTYSDGRHPDDVEFVSDIETDLARRDFTMNAMAFHPERGLLDCWGGMQDIEARVIRVVGNAADRFSEDALRIMRGCRFCSQLGFTIEAETKQAMCAHKMRLHSVASERLAHEMTELLLGEHVHDALMECVDVISAVFPELAAMKGFDQHTPYHIYDVWEHTAWVVQRSPQTPIARWAALFHDCGKPGAFFMEGERAHFYGHPLLSVVLARGALDRMPFSASFKADVLELVRIHDVVIAATPQSVKKALGRLGGDVGLFKELIGLKRADAMAQSSLSEPRIQLADDLERVLGEVLSDQAAFTVRQLAVNGHDLIQLGVPEGPAVGDALQACLDAVVDERIPNERDEVLAFIRERLQG